MRRLMALAITMGIGSAVVSGIAANVAFDTHRSVHQIVATGCCKGRVLDTTRPPEAPGKTKSRPAHPGSGGRGG